MGINKTNFNKIKKELSTILKNQNTELDKLNTINKYFHENYSEITKLFNANNKWAAGCERNSQMFKLLCNELGIEGVECKTGIYTDVYGRAEEHMWCEVTVEGKTYIYDMAQKQVLPKGWSPNPSNPTCGYKEGKVTAPKSMKNKTQVGEVTSNSKSDNTSTGNPSTFSQKIKVAMKKVLPESVYDKFDNVIELQKLKAKIGTNSYILDNLKNNPNGVRFANKYLENGGNVEILDKIVEHIKSTTYDGRVSNEVYELFLSLQNAKINDNNILKFVKNIVGRENIIKNTKFQMKSSLIEKINKFSNTKIDELALLKYVELQIKHPSINTSEFIKNYISHFKPEELSETMSNDYLNNIKVYLKEMEIDGKNIDVKELKEIISNYKFDNIRKILCKQNGLSERTKFDIEYLMDHDEMMFKEIVEIMNKVEKKSTESVSEYFTRICDIRQKQIDTNKQVQFKKRKDVLNKGYSETDDYVPLVLSSEAMKEYNDWGNETWKRKVADNSFDLGGNYAVTGLDILNLKYERYAFQNYPRYNSREFLGKNTDYKYAPVYRFLDPKSSSIETFSKNAFPNIGDEYIPNKFQSCSPRFEYCAGEPMLSHSRFPVVMEIHPKNETSKAFFIGGKGGEEMRYPGDTKFKVIDKYIDINEETRYGKTERNPMMFIILQEL